MRIVLFIAAYLFVFQAGLFPQTGLSINQKEYFEMPGLNVMVFHDYYPDGHQTGVTVIQHGERIAANGDLRLESTPGQWQPVPKVGKRSIDRNNNEISVSLWYPDSSKDRKGFNPIFYPDLKLKYKVRVKAAGKAFKIYVDLENPLPEEWVGKAGFNLELFPGALFGKSFIMDNFSGIFPRQADGPMYIDKDGEYQMTPMAEGQRLVIAPENEEIKMTILSAGQKLMLIDGRGKHNNGWFVVRSLIPKGKTTGAIEWELRPNVIENWKYKPTVQISQVGYHTRQQKTAVIEQDKSENEAKSISLIRYNEEGVKEEVLTEKPAYWGEFLRYKYFKFDFSKITKAGIYQIRYGDYLTNPFKISDDVYKRHVWQPTLEYFLPVQMCHMRVNEGYRVWHGLCHDDDALMAATDTNHFDGYVQGNSTLTKYKSSEHVPGLNAGGWHDAGDYDLRVESQADEVHLLSMAYEEFNVNYDETKVDQQHKLVEIHQPDGKPDILQQIEHGVLSIVNGYNSMGRFYRGIICPTLRQYTLLGDGVNETDGKTGNKDDRWVFTEENPYREIQTAKALAASARALKDYNPELSVSCLNIAENVWNASKASGRDKIEAAAELFLTTGKKEYRDFLTSRAELIAKNISNFGWTAARVISKIDDKNFTERVTEAVSTLYGNLVNQQAENPYGVPYHPDIWGAGWGIQEFGVRQYFLYKGFPTIFSPEYMLNALNFVLGCHPGKNTASFASGVGANSMTVAYGANRADWSYIPGGVGSGTAIIRPDLPELKVWPFFWQQAEYVMGGGASNFMFLVLAADKILNYEITSSK